MLTLTTRHTMNTAAASASQKHLTSNAHSYAPNVQASLALAARFLSNLISINSVTSC